MIEGLVRWFKVYDRMAMIDGLLSLNINNKIDYKNMERHFKKEIEELISKRLGSI